MSFFVRYRGAGSVLAYARNAKHILFVEGPACRSHADQRADENLHYSEERN
jgi:hypothetical protein